jgi:hypothetical protein
LARQLPRKSGSLMQLRTSSLRGVRHDRCSRDVSLRR